MKSFAITDVGLKRKDNQDYVYCTEEGIGHLPNLFVVADGMGGHNAGDTASRTCVETLCDHIENSDLTTPVSILNEAVMAAHAKVLVLARSFPEFEGMGTTLVAATIIDNTLYTANIGDSRLYILRDSLRQITEDHSLVEEMVKSGEIEKNEVRSHPNRNIITRALGIGKDIRPDYFEIELEPDDIILMCSDGLTNMLEDSEIEYMIKKNRGNPDKAAMELLTRANESGGRDNITILIVEA